MKLFKQLPITESPANRHVLTPGASRQAVRGIVTILLLLAAGPVRYACGQAGSMEKLVPAMSPAVAVHTLLTPPATAENYLYRLADKSKNKRQIAGFGVMGLGGLMIGVGASLTANASEDDILNLSQGLGEMYLVTGGLTMVAGIVRLASLSPSERRWNVIRSIPDPDMRDREAVLALRELARIGRTRRIVLSALNAIGAVATMVADEPDSEIMAASLSVSALIGLAVKSAEEKAHDNYTRTIAHPVEWNWGLGVGAEGRPLLTAALSF